MLKTFALTIVLAAFALPAAASTGTQDNQSTQATSAKNTQLAQRGGVYCRKGTRWDHRQQTCVPQ